MKGSRTVLTLAYGGRVVGRSDAPQNSLSLSCFLHPLPQNSLTLMSVSVKGKDDRRELDGRKE